MTTFLTRARFLALGAALLASLHVPASAQPQQPAAAAKPATKVSFRLDWKSSGQHSPFFLGRERGFYAAEGIDLNIVSGSGSSDSVKQLGAGAVELAIVDALVLVQAAEQQVPVKAIGAYYQRTPIVLLSPKTKPVTDPKQLLSGMKIGSKRASSTSQGLTALLAVNNIDPKKINLVDIGFGVQPLLVGQVDALMGFTMNEAIEAESAGMPVHELMLSDHGVKAYGLMLAANEKFLSSRPELVRGFLRATRRSIEAANADKAAAVQALAKVASEIDVPREIKVLTKAAPFWFANSNDVASFGTQSAQGWQQTIETARRVGLIETTPNVQTLFVAGLDK